MSMNRNNQKNQREIKTIPIASLVVGAYQRPLDIKRAQRIAKNFNIHKLEYPTVSLQPNGLYNIVNGNHRITAAKIYGMKEIDCIVVNLTLVQEAELFSTQNEGVKPIKPLDSFNAWMFEDSENAVMAKTIKEAVERAGYKINDSGGAYNIQCINAIIRVYKKYSASMLADTLNLIRSAWPFDTMGKRGDVIEGVSHFMNLCATQGRADNTEIIRKLSTRPLSYVMQAAYARSSSGGGRYYSISEVLTELYNQKRKSPDTRVKFMR